MLNQTRGKRGLGAPIALPLSFAALLVIGAVAAGLDGRLSARWVLVLAAIVVMAMSTVAEPAMAPLVGVIGWLTVVGFSGRPYAQLRMTGSLPGRAAVVMVVCVCLGASAGWLMRRLTSSFTLWIVDIAGDRRPVPDDLPPGQPFPGQIRPSQIRPEHQIRPEQRRPSRKLG